MEHGYSSSLDNIEENKTNYLGFGNMFQEFLESGRKNACILNLETLGKMGIVPNRQKNNYNILEIHLI